MSRARWLAFGPTLAIVGCSGEVAKTAASAVDATAETESLEHNATAVDDSASAQGGEAGRGDESATKGAAPSDASLDVAGRVSDATRQDQLAPVDGSLASLDGGLHCKAYAVADAQDFVCDPATQWCFTNHGFDTTGCVSLGSTCPPDADGGACSVFYWDAAACDPGYSRCACLTVTCNPGSCIEDDGGGITVSCGNCYGAPPVRLERLA